MARGADPIEAIVGLARRMVLDAMDGGWTGPPYDPALLARLKGIALVPNEDIPDARMIPAGAGGRARQTIEYNPNRPRARIRFSLAHELAHTLFPDHAERIRNRSDRQAAHGDREVELLCDIAAAEILMPAIPESGLESRPLNMDNILYVRDRYEASTEATMIRLVGLSPKPAALFSASKTGNSAGAPYAIDYMICPPNYSPPFRQREVLSIPALAECTAVGYTSAWSGELPGASGAWKIECVGVSPQRGRVYPRVLAIARPASPAAGLPAISYRVGDATKPRGDGPAIIAHVANDKSPRWGRGFGHAVTDAFSGIRAEFTKWAGARPSLGAVHVYEASPRGPIVVTMVAQSGYGPSARPRIRYAHLSACLELLADEAERRGASVHMPRIGTGHAGGSWEIVSGLVHRHLIRRGISVTVYDTPATARPAPVLSLLEYA